MANVLEKIVLDKREEVAALKVTKPLSSFKDELTNSNNSFYDALAAPGPSYIFECKKASPSKGLIRAHFDLDEITQAYQREAACFSVLTDEKYFQGKHEYLTYVSEKVSQPTLNKDFFIDTYQVYLARHLQANAVLLMLSVLTDQEYLELSECAKSLNMDVLTEVSNLEETHRALALNAKIIGINNRNLRDLSTDLSTTEKLVPVIRQDERFDGVIISESGIYTHADIQRLSPLVDGFLVGSALMLKDDLIQAVSQLVYGAVKVCGITSIEQAKLLQHYPTSYLGLIFAPESKRYLSFETAQEITSSCSGRYVGVFVNQRLEMVADYALRLSLAAVQLHGDESLEYIRRLRKVLPEHCELWVAQGITNDVDTGNALHNILSERLPLIDDNIINRIVLDCKVGKQSGGTGQSFNWQIISDVPASVLSKQAIVLAGGINVENAKLASGLSVGLIDVNSGVEDKPGNKTKEKLDAFFSQLRG